MKWKLNWNPFRKKKNSRQELSAEKQTNLRKDNYLLRALRVHATRSVRGIAAPLVMLSIFVILAVFVGKLASAYRVMTLPAENGTQRRSNAYYLALQAEFEEGSILTEEDTAVVLGDSIFSSNAILIDVTDGERVLCIKNPDEKAYPASLTKMMTVLVALDHITNLYDTYLLEQDIFDYAASENASVAGFLSGEEVCVVDLLYGTFLPSGAEAAIGLARYACGNEQTFVSQMNQKAEQLGMTSTHFTNVTGLHDEDQYTTARDMAKLLMAGMQNPRFKKILTSTRYSTQPSNLHAYGFTVYSTVYSAFQRNDMEMGYVQGGKTGYTPEAGQCLATYSIRDDHEYVLVTMGAGNGSNQVAYHIFDAQAILETYAGVK